MIKKENIFVYFLSKFHNTYDLSIKNFFLITFIFFLNSSSPTILLSIRTIAADLDVVSCSSINVISIREDTSNLTGLDDINPSSHITGIK